MVERDSDTAVGRLLFRLRLWIKNIFLCSSKTNHIMSMEIAQEIVPCLLERLQVSTLTNLLVRNVAIGNGDVASEAGYLASTGIRCLSTSNFSLC